MPHSYLIDTSFTACRELVVVRAFLIDISTKYLSTPRFFVDQMLIPHNQSYINSVRMKYRVVKRWHKAFLTSVKTC